jgi:hypothetical protein
MSTLPEDLDKDDAPTWSPQPGDKLAGVIVNIEILNSKFGNKEQYPYLELDTDDGVVGWHAAQTVAKSQLRRVRPQVGDVIAVKYRGDEKGYKDFVVKSDRNVEVNWNEIGSDDGE